MTKKEERFTKRRLRSAYLSVIVSIALVLFVLGIFGVLLINTQTISRSIKEDFALTILLQDDASTAEVNQFFTSLKLAPYTKAVEIISKEDAAEELKSILDEDFIDFLGYNPLQDGIELKLKAEYLSSKKLGELERDFSQKKFVQEIVYDKILVVKMNENLRILSLALFIGAFLLSLIAIALINSSIRLAIYSKRFIIKTMQLVGATTGFIRKPFLYRSLIQGFIGSSIAVLLLFSGLSWLSSYLPGFAELQNKHFLLILGVSILVLGLLISITCTFFALKKYLRLKTDQLYF
jgi:cell division transport system permease protein